MTSKPKDIVSSTTMKPILNIKSNDRDYHGNKNRICNGRKLFRTSGSKRGVSNDQMDENWLMKMRIIKLFCLLKKKWNQSTILSKDFGGIGNIVDEDTIKEDWNNYILHSW